MSVGIPDRDDADWPEDVISFRETITRVRAEYDERGEPYSEALVEAIKYLEEHGDSH